MKKPISVGDWVLWYGLWKIAEIKEEHVPEHYRNKAGLLVAVLEPINVRSTYYNWYLSDVKYHGGVTVRSLKRINPVSAIKRGYTKPLNTNGMGEWRYRHCP